jgi:hypothetical protein
MNLMGMAVALSSNIAKLRSASYRRLDADDTGRRILAPNPLRWSKGMRRIKAELNGARRV